ncbi:glycosyltransferase family 4 protein [Paenibacillus etheri]|uniref:Glycosyl transferase family 1 n=1 Tax=Paenibacillus etheri TaxID=1306852 RepID=A0A0W1B4F7_9BACL|nr:glycosyltransferase family 4 protein [Paenibacillus etheri]KTD88411.1 glycosyl transferase family 1 [Paenibacillus etheri]
MKILWLTNIPLPEASTLMNSKSLPFGGWLVNTSKYLANSENIELSITFPCNSFREFNVLNGEKIIYYPFPQKKKESEVKRFLEEIVDRSRPEIVHIFGTEYIHTLEMVNICNERKIKVLISIQGLVSIYAQHYMANLPRKVQNKFTFRDLIKRDNLVQQQLKFQHRGIFEILALKKVKHVLGRTTWDKACTLQINPHITYHYCNETLRESFYNAKWDIEHIEEHSIFISQGTYPIKGLHHMLEAMSIIIKKFPKAKLYVGGIDNSNDQGLKAKLKKNSYGKYINHLIKKFNLQDKVFFTGSLYEKEMLNRYLRANVFVCPSSIENSPNSLGEAMILGVPCVASFVGGVSDLLIDKQEGFLYQSDAPYMLAHYVCEIFTDNNLALKFSISAREHALRTHDRESNLEKITQIYNNIVELSS